VVLEMTAPAASPEPPEPPIAAGLVTIVTAGMTRAGVVKSLGPPHGNRRIAGASQDIETLTYNLDSGGHASIQLEGGKVLRITR
jgi:hypothetical protein